MRDWLGRLGVKTAFIEPSSPWENGYDESFNGKLRDELLDREIFYSLAEARVLIEAWRVHYNTVRPHSATARLHPKRSTWPALDECATAAVRLRCAPPPVSRGAGDSHALTLPPDHLMGAGHQHEPCSQGVRSDLGARSGDEAVGIALE